jgi:hypothetical protein
MLTPRHRRAVPVVAAGWALVWAALSPLLSAGLLLWAPTSDAPFALWLARPCKAPHSSRSGRSSWPYAGQSAAPRSPSS